MEEEDFKSSTLIRSTTAFPDSTHFATFKPVDPNAGYNDALLQSKASQGDEEAFRVLFDRYHARLFQYIFKIIKSKEAAEEITMDVFLKLWLSREMMTEIKNMDAFLFRVAYNKSIDFFRAAAKDQQFTELLWEKIQAPSHSGSDTPIIMREYEAKLREAIDLLPPQRRKVFDLSREEGLSHAQIAEQLGISKNTVANTIVEARQFIKAYLSKNLDLVVLMTALSHFLKQE
jgi:RNA polymerase sigma-70 factor (ECF subfamily)